MGHANDESRALPAWGVSGQENVAAGRDAAWGEKQYKEHLERKDSAEKENGEGRSTNEHSQVTAKEAKGKSTQTLLQSTGGKNRTDRAAAQKQALEARQESTVPKAGDAEDEAEPSAPAASKDCALQLSPSADVASSRSWAAGQLVWARHGQHPHWPAQITDVQELTI